MNGRRSSNRYSITYINHNSFSYKKNSYAVHFIKTIVHFVFLTRYFIHDDLTLNYLKNALFWINILKDVFREHRLLNKKTKKKYFNIFKFHMILHFKKDIKLYNIIDNFNTKHTESRHIKVKEYFDQINKQDIWPH